MDRHDRAEAVVLARQHQAQFLAIELAARGVQRRRGLVRSLGILAAFLLGHCEVNSCLVEAFAQTLIAGELALYLVLFAQRCLGGVGPVPEVGLG